ncbi:MAG: metallophosphoesterase [Leptolyngbyaceae cyanobacterium bins.59]|nr:metallophosphoesterase [Leptolyngbyaceae cyanobacterium bins.59]
MHRLLTGPLTVESLTIPIANLPDSWQGMKLVQLSDFHYDGVRLSEWLLSEAIEAVNQVEPDLILLTGDFVTDVPTPVHQLVTRLKHLQSRLGIYAVLGNHDLYYRKSKDEVTKALTSIGVKVLWNEVVYPQGDEVALVGLADYWSKQFQPAPVFEAIDPQIPRIVMSHNPDSVEDLQQWRVDLQLSGHTHGGQIVIPGLGPILAYLSPLRHRVPKSARKRLPVLEDPCFRVVQNWQWAAGFYQAGQIQLYVNRGLGTYLPGRLFCNPEVTVMTLLRAGG